MPRPPTGAFAITDLFRLIYSSQPFGYDSATLSNILLDARRCNERDDVTGALVCRHDIYLQLLEGPRPMVEAAFARVRRDDRHIDIRTHVSETVEDRLFADWAMLHDPANSLIWTAAEIEDGALERASPDDVTKMFRELEAKARANPE